MTAAPHRGVRLDIEKRPGDSLRVAFRVRERIRDAQGHPQPGAGQVVDISSWTMAASAAPEGGPSFPLTVELLTDGTDGRLIVSGTADAMAAITWAGHWQLRRTDTDTTVAYGRITMEDPQP